MCCKMFAISAACVYPEESLFYKDVLICFGFIMAAIIVLMHNG